MREYSFTSESVSNGHPDKVADQVADAILDACLQQDTQSRVACEVLVSRNLVVLAGEISTQAVVDYEKVTREVIRTIGYTKRNCGFDDGCQIVKNFSEQSPDIACGVNTNEGLFREQGAGDQGMVFGYACRDTAELMPLPIMLSHRLMRNLVQLRKDGHFPFLGPDAKAQVSVKFYEKGKLPQLDAVVFSTQHDQTITHKELTGKMECFVKETLHDITWDSETKCYINPTGVFLHGGPASDTGLTGRKIIVDTYGGMSRHGGGAFSGKDPSKVDRSAAYAARYVAKNIVASELASRCELQIAYAIGVAEPVAIYINTFGTNQVAEEVIVSAIRDIFDLTPHGIMKMLDLTHQRYFPTAFGGHFGQRNGEFSWEKTDKVEMLKQFVHAVPSL